MSHEKRDTNKTEARGHPSLRAYFNNVNTTSNLQIPVLWRYRDQHIFGRATFGVPEVQSPAHDIWLVFAIERLEWNRTDNSSLLSTGHSWSSILNWHGRVDLPTCTLMYFFTPSNTSSAS